MINKKVSNKLNIFIIILLIIFFTLVGYFLGSNKNILTNKQKSSSNLLTINYHTPIGEKGSLLTFKISFPDTYFATTDEMITHYKSQGGMAPPVIMLTKGYQPLAKNTDENQNYVSRYNEIEKSGKDCILVWQTSGLSSLEDWYNIQGVNYNILSKKTEKIGNYNVSKVKAIDKEKNVQLVQAFIKLPEDESYYFQTCNMNSENDLDVVLKNFDLRGNL